MQIQESEYFTQELSFVASYSILTIQLLVVCLTLVRWLKTVTAKALTSRQKEKTHGKKNNFTVRQKENDSRQEEKPHGKKKTSAKRKRLTGKFIWYRDDILILISFAMRSWLFFLQWGYLRLLPWGFSFCSEVNSFARQLWATVPLKFCSRRFLIFQRVGIHEN